MADQGIIPQFVKRPRPKASQKDAVIEELVEEDLSGDDSVSVDSTENSKISGVTGKKSNKSSRKLV